MKLHHLIILWLTLVSACQNIEDANPMERDTFARFYESASSLEGIAAQTLSDGYLFIANHVDNTDTMGYLVRTDLSGSVQWKTELPSMHLTGLAAADDGYFVLADSIKVNAESAQVADLIVYSALLYKTDLEGSIMNKLRITDSSSANKIDFRTNAVTFNTDNEIVMLGTFQDPTAISTSTRPFVNVLNASTLDTVWSRTYEVYDRDYVNTRSVIATSDDHILWASAILKEQQNFARSYLAIPYVLAESTFQNFDVYGSTTDQSLYAYDIATATTSLYGYGVIGTYASPSGENANMFFARISTDGNFIDNSERFFDGILSIDNEAVSLGTSSSQDEGLAICATGDGGFVLAGTMETTPTRGNGGLDIFLVKVNGIGTMRWNKILGGTGDETVQSIQETADGGLLLCGSKDASGLPVPFLIKTDAYGNIEI